MSFQEYIDSRIPLLRSLHASLGLPSHHLNADLELINLQVRKAIDGVVEGREEEVKEMARKVDEVGKGLERLRLAMGVKGDEGDGGVRFDTRMPDGIPFPDQLAALQVRLQSAHFAYTERLSLLRTHAQTLTTLLDFLGPTFTLPLSLSARLIPSSTSQPQTTPAAQGEPQTLEERGQAEEPLEDVGPDRLQALIEGISLAQQAKTDRSNLLLSTLEDTRYLAGSLSLFTTVSIPAALPADAQPQLLPEGTTYEQREMLVRFLTDFQPPVEDAAGWLVESQPGKLAEGVEPTLEVLQWVADVKEMWNQEESRRRARIQELYAELEAIVRRLGEDETELAQFVDANCGLSMRSLDAYQAKVEEAKLKRKQNVALYIEAARADIVKLWEILLYGPHSMANFSYFHEDEFTDESLDEHERYVDQLNTEQETKGSMLSKVQEWMKMRMEDLELIEKETGPDRFNTRGGALLQQQKLRKRIDALRPRIENDLLVHIPEWEEKYGQAFLVEDVRIVEVIEEDRAQREAKKVVRGKPAASTKAPAKAPARAPAKPAVGATPARPLTNRPNQTPSTFTNPLSRSQTLKREAPSTITPLAKRSKIQALEAGTPTMGPPKSGLAYGGARVVSAPVVGVTPRALGPSTAANLRHSVDSHGREIKSGIPLKQHAPAAASADVFGSKGRRMSFKPSQRAPLASNFGYDAGGFAIGDEILEEE